MWKCIKLTFWSKNYSSFAFYKTSLSKICYELNCSWDNSKRHLKYFCICSTGHSPKWWIHTRVVLYKNVGFSHHCGWTSVVYLACQPSWTQAQHSGAVSIVQIHIYFRAFIYSYCHELKVPVEKK